MERTESNHKKKANSEVSLSPKSIGGENFRTTNQAFPHGLAHLSFTLFHELQAQLLTRQVRIHKYAGTLNRHVHLIPSTPRPLPPDHHAHLPIRDPPHLFIPLIQNPISPPHCPLLRPLDPIHTLYQCRKCDPASFAYRKGANSPTGTE